MYLDIFPTPKKVEVRQGRFSFGNEMTFNISKDFSMSESLGLMSEIWNNFTLGVSYLTFESSESEAFVWKTGDVKTPVLDDGFSYCLEVSESGFAIKGRDDVSLLHAFYTLLQLIYPVDMTDGKEVFAVNCGKISDAPDSKYRFKHISLAKSFSLNQIKKYIRLTGFLKYSHLIVEFRGNLKFDSLPEFSWPDAFTKDQIRPLLEEARLMGVELIPLFNSLGHGGMGGLMDGRNVVLDQNPKLQLLFEPDGWSFCITNPDTRKLIKNLQSELIELCGPGEFFHMGLDESHDFATCENCSKFDKATLLADFVNSVAKDMREIGRRTMVWADMLIEKERFDPEEKYKHATHFPVGNASKNLPTHKALSKFDKDVIIVDWQYYTDDPENPTAKYFSDEGFDVIPASWDDFKNMVLLAKNTADNNYFGYMSTSWGDLKNLIDQFIFNSELCWNLKNTDSVDSHRLEPRFYRTANLIRKLVPPMGVYENSGWK